MEITLTAVTFEFMETSAVVPGAFMVLSYPHFLHADSRYRNGVIGMNPIEEEHRIFLDLEPVSCLKFLNFPSIYNSCIVRVGMIIALSN